VSPAPARTSDAAVVAAARRVVEEGGVEALTMQAVAAAVGIRAPSLYKRFADRAAILRAVARDALAELGAAVEGASSARRPEARLRAMAGAYRGWAHAHPRVYALLFAGDAPAGADPGVEPRAAATARLLETLAGVVGEARALPAARLLVAFLHGFVSMELAGAFRLGGSVDDAFAFAMDAILAGLPRASGDPDPARGF
jgi:AcrR family transcriptional regulator